MRVVFARLFAALLVLSATAVEAGPPLPTSPPFSLPSSASGNGLVNFANPALTTNAHKKILYVGNSTVWNATQYFGEFCNYLNASTTGTGNVFGQLGLTPCTTTVTSYTINNTTGSITVNFTGAAPSGYTVGDLIASEPTTGGSLTQIVGTGVVTAIGASSITYQLLAINPFPSSTGTTSSGGYVTNSLLNLGYNGATSTAINSIVTPLLGKYAKPGDLVLVRGPIINDVRLGACALSCAVANVKALYTSIAASVPPTTDIAWKTENSLLTTDPTASGYVSPLGSSSAYSAILQSAVFQAFAALPARAVVWDNMQIVYSKLGGEYQISNWMTDILHPNFTGQIREADADVQILTQILAGKGFAPQLLSNPNQNTATNGAQLNGDPTWLAALRAQVGFSQFMTEHAQDDNYAAPWTLYPDGVLDPNRYQTITYGILSAPAASGQTYLRFSAPESATGTVNPARILPGDLIWLQGIGVTVVNAGAYLATFNCGGTNYCSQLTSLTSTPAVPNYTPIVVVRQNSYVINDVAKFQDTATWTYRHRITFNASGTNYLRISFLDSAVSWPNAVATSDYIDASCGEISLSGATFQSFSTYMQINLTGSWASCSGSTGWLFGTHAMESVSAMNIAPATLITGSAPTATGTCAVNTQTGGATAGTFKANGACASGTVILTFSTTAANGWACDAHDQTTVADAMNQTASSSTSVTFGGSMASGDVVAFKCAAF